MNFGERRNTFVSKFFDDVCPTMFIFRDNIDDAAEAPGVDSTSFTQSCKQTVFDRRLASKKKFNSSPGEAEISAYIIIVDKKISRYSQHVMVRAIISS